MKNNIFWEFGCLKSLHFCTFIEIFRNIVQWNQEVLKKFIVMSKMPGKHSSALLQPKLFCDSAIPWHGNHGSEDLCQAPGPGREMKSFWSQKLSSSMSFLFAFLMCFPELSIMSLPLIKFIKIWICWKEHIRSSSSEQGRLVALCHKIPKIRQRCFLQQFFKCFSFSSHFDNSKMAWISDRNCSSPCLVFFIFKVIIGANICFHSRERGIFLNIKSGKLFKILHHLHMCMKHNHFRLKCLVLIYFL